jgi:methionine transaminase
MTTTPQTSTNIFTHMSALAQRHGAVNLGQGFPDYAMDDALVELAAAAMRAGYNQYLPMAGHLPLREAIAEKLHRSYGVSVCPQDGITITPGGTYAIYTAIGSVVAPGDEVLLFEPAYDSYIPNILAHGGVPVCIPLKHPHYTVDWQQVQAAITPRTKLVLINSPHNPSGQVWSAADLNALAHLVRHTNIVVLSDEVYEHLIYDNFQHQSALAHPELASRALVCFSLGKVYNCTGWKIGYCVAPANFSAAFRQLHQYCTFSVSSPLQVALAQYLRLPHTYQHLSATLQQKRDHLRHLLSATPLKPIASHGSYFELYSYQGLSHLTELEMAESLVTEAKVAVIPTSAFYHQPANHDVLRLCFAKKTETLEMAASRLISHFDRRTA